jgi:hypothetical protein
MSRWYRAYEGTVTDPKLGEVALVAGCSRSVAIATWHAILESCAVTNDGGRFDATPRRIAVALGEPVATIESAFAEMAALGMIAEGCVEAWSRRQFERGDAGLRPNAAEWAVLRRMTFERDNFTCVYCGARGKSLECDHIIPVSRGGSNSQENLATACKPCNRSKRDRTPEEMGWRQ